MYRGFFFIDLIYISTLLRRVSEAIDRVKQSSAFDQTLRILSERIDQGEYPPDSKLPPLRDIAQQLSVGISTVREALRVLQNQGKVRLEQGRGTFVTAGTETPPPPSRDATPPDIDPDKSRSEWPDLSFVELLEARLVVEPDLAALAAKRGEKDDIVQIVEAAESMAKDVREGRNFLNDDIAFHDHVVRAAGNRALQRMMDSLERYLREGRRYSISIPGSVEKAAHYHQMIADAIERREAERARELMHQHIEQVLYQINVSLGDV